MGTRYGVPYQGSKNKIADFIMSKLPPSPVFVDVFAGGCAMTHCAMLSGKYERFIVNDISDATELFQKAINGDFINEKRWISREDFERLKSVDPYVRICWSFNNNENDYIYSSVYEPWKKALHYARVFNDFSLFERMGIHTDGMSKDIRENSDKYKELYILWYMKTVYGMNERDIVELQKRYQKTEEELRQYLRDALTRSGLKQADVNRRLGTQMAGHYFGASQWAFPTREYYEQMRSFMDLPLEYSDCVDEYSDILKKLQDLHDLYNLQSLQSLQSLQRLQRLQMQLQSLQSLTSCMNKDYSYFTEPDSDDIKRATFYYCDPPYKDTEGYTTNEDAFDYERFENWLDTVDKPCIVSEYTAPRGCVEIAQTEKRCDFGSGAMTKDKGTRTEKLFIQSRYLEWYKSMMYNDNNEPGGSE